MISCIELEAREVSYPTIKVLVMNFIMPFSRWQLGMPGLAHGGVMTTCCERRIQDNDAHGLRLLVHMFGELATEDVPNVYLLLSN